MEGIVHAQNGQQGVGGGDAFEKSGHLLFLRGQLVFVGHVQPAAAAATSEGGTQGARQALPRIVGGLGQGATKVAPYGGFDARRAPFPLRAWGQGATEVAPCGSAPERLRRGRLARSALGLAGRLLVRFGLLSCFLVMASF